MDTTMEQLLALIETTQANPSTVLLAHYLGVSRQTVYKRAHKYGIDLQQHLLTREDIRKLGTAITIKTDRKSAIDHVKDQRDAAQDQRDAAQARVAELTKQLAEQEKKLAKENARHRDAERKEQQRNIEQVNKALDALVDRLDLIDEHSLGVDETLNEIADSLVDREAEQSAIKESELFVYRQSKAIRRRKIRTRSQH